MSPRVHKGQIPVIFRAKNIKHAARNDILDAKVFSFIILDKKISLVVMVT